ncbi:Zinc finger C2H2 [Penicillium bovifimosum]|uniref:Zinc finger C2H2 n=1 Tax=Penicillium bovifimosum TaxID=126998 RepID=A0A9W9KV48_9EURO|nr:Zinc finger C2H2 [Penicillium bovifimosum]KAJ5120575.1 Zinc finger C2H2 [Penicillium bovifimosum]
MTSQVAIAFARPPFEAGAKPSFSMATLMSNEPIAVSNPISGNNLTSSESLSLFKSSKPDSLSSIASAGLHVSRSRDQLPPMTSPTSAPADRPEHEKDAERNSSQVAREALGASEKSPGAQIHEPSVHASPEHMQIDSHATEHSSDPYGSNDPHHNSLMHSSTVASPGPIEESTSQDGDRRSRDPSEIDHDGKAFSYPMPTGNMNDPRRGLSLPTAGYSRGSPRSPSAKKHRCPYCATEFTRQHNLKSHLLTHSQEKPFVCQTCQSRFRRLHDLKRHTKLHTGERPHICPKCGRRFARGDALARHNKGQGGCAGRRASMGSFAADDEYGDGTTGQTDDMDGLMYTAEPERMDEEDERRLTMPSIRKHEADGIARSDSLHPRQSNTYPPIAAGRPSHLFPPPANHGGSSMSTSTSQSTHMTFPPAGLTSGSSIFPSNINDSPKPLSPNALSSQHESAPPHRAHSPGIGQSLPHPQSSFGRTNQSTNPAPPTLGLPLPQPGAPQLPPPPGMTSPDGRFGMQAATKHTPSHSHSSTHSLSHHKGFDGPDNNSNHTDPNEVNKLWAYVRTLHDELTGLRAEVASLRAHVASSNSVPLAPVEVNLNNSGPR